MMKLSIIIPVFNEERTIGELLRKVNVVKLPKHFQKEVIVVNDGSTDLTSTYLKNFRFKDFSVYSHSKNQGKGRAVRTGLEKATGDLVLIQDADLEYDPKDYLKLIKPIILGQTQVVYGTRLKDYPLKLFGHNKTPLPTHWVGNKLLTLLTNLLYGSNITDMETCYKLFIPTVIEGIKLNSSRFEIEPEITAKILKQGYKIVEVPIKVNPRTRKEGKKISWRDGFVAIWTLIKYRVID